MDRDGHGFLLPEIFSVTEVTLRGDASHVRVMNELFVNTVAVLTTVKLPLKIMETLCRQYGRCRLQFKFALIRIMFLRHSP